MTIPEPSKDELFRLWESGVPLDSAWIEFSVSLDRFALAALRIHPDDDLKIHGLHNREYKELINSGRLPKTSEGRKKKLEVMTENGRVHLLRKICTGELWAIAFRTLPSGLREPIEVRRQLFIANEGPEQRTLSNIDWGKSELRDGDVCYFDIRVVRPPLGADEIPSAPQPPASALQALQEARSDDVTPAPELPAGEAPKPEPSDSGRTPPQQIKGRPPTRDRIRSAVEQLWKTDETFRSMPHRIDQARAVRAHLLGESTRHLDDMPEYRSSTIVRIIGEAAKELKQSE
jgi:hypothetical protein